MQQLRIYDYVGPQMAVKMFQSCGGMNRYARSISLTNRVIAARLAGVL